MTIYVPSDELSGVSIGKDIPGMGPFRNYTPKLQGPGGAKVKIAILAAKYGYNYVRKHYKFFTGVGVVASGAAVNYGKTKTNGPYRETRGTIQSRYYRKRNARNKNFDQCCCCTKQHRRGKRRFYR